jgi:hypothetical protein
MHAATDHEDTFCNVICHLYEKVLLLYVKGVEGDKQRGTFIWMMNAVA